MASGKSPGMLMHNAGIFNPVLVQAVGLCPVVAMATSLRSAALLAVVSAVIVTLSEFIASLFLKRVPRWVRIGIYIILAQIKRIFYDFYRFFKNFFKVFFFVWINPVYTLIFPEPRKLSFSIITGALL